MAVWRRVGRGQIRVAAIVAAVAFTAVPGAYAEVRIGDGASGAVVIEAREATVQEILDMLGNARNLRVHSSVALSRVVTGTYSGSLPRVLSRLLNGYDNVIRSSPAGVELTILGAATASKSGPNGAMLVVRGPQTISGNVDLDEEEALARSGNGRNVGQPRSVAPPSAPRPIAGSGGNALPPNAPAVARISNNVDLDEENAR